MEDIRPNEQQINTEKNISTESQHILDVPHVIRPHSPEEAQGFQTIGEEMEESSFDLRHKDHDYVQQLGNFEYMPTHFHQIDTKGFGFATRQYDDQGHSLPGVNLHPFMKLKEIALDSGIDASDRMQAVRFMCFIPYLRGEDHCIEATRAILFDDSIDIYKRYYFFSNNERFFKLTDTIVYTLHPEFFEQGLLRQYPFELIVRSARYTLSFYPVDTTTRQHVLDWVLDVADDPNESHRARAEAADILITCGEPDETEFGAQIISQIDTHSDFYESKENVHSDGFTESAKKIIRALQSDPRLDRKEALNLEDILQDLLCFADDLEDKKTFQQFFYRIQTDPTRFERLTLLDIFFLMYRKIKSLIRSSPMDSEKIENIFLIRLYQEIMDASDTCATGYLLRILNVLQGFVEEKEFQLRMNPKDEIRSVVFARLNLILRTLGSRDQKLILDSMEGEDKTAAQEFLRTYEIEEELWEEYQPLMEEEEFKRVLQKCLHEFIGIFEKIDH
jgi:hypothetical protein